MTETTKQQDQLYLEYLQMEHDNEVFKQLEKICEENEYKLCCAYRSKTRVYITIRSYCDINRTRCFQPEIGYYYDLKTILSADGHLRLGEFRISQRGIGSMGVEEFENVVKGSQQAINIVNEASKLDFSKLYEYPED